MSHTASATTQQQTPPAPAQMPARPLSPAEMAVVAGGPVVRNDET